jgi:hypothetical protein
VVNKVWCARPGAAEDRCDRCDQYYQWSLYYAAVLDAGNSIAAADQQTLTASLAAYRNGV